MFNFFTIAAPSFVVLTRRSTDGYRKQRDSFRKIEKLRVFREDDDLRRPNFRFFDGFPAQQVAFGSLGIARAKVN